MCSVYEKFEGKRLCCSKSAAITRGLRLDFIFNQNCLFNGCKMLNPYKSSIKLKNALFNPLLHNIPEKPQVDDFKVKPLKKFFRPIYSPYTNSWEVDLGFIEGSKQIGYLFFINENTRYLYAWPTFAKNMETLADGFLNFLQHFGNRSCRLKGDGEKAFAGIANRMMRKTPILSTDGVKTRSLCTNEKYKRNVK